ncbi:MAG: hypothetical protein WC703_10540 [Candidatus Neomarinimicrobiota bacterium]
MKWIKSFREINKLYYTNADVVKITELTPSSVNVLLNRLVKQKELIRLTTNCYILPERNSDIPLIANQLVFPSYLSFESALSLAGVLSQIPYTLTFATILKTKHIRLGDRKIEYRQIQSNLFQDYVQRSDGLWIAEPEKALFDLIYFTRLGKSKADLSTLDYSKIDPQRLEKMLTKFYPNREKNTDGTEQNADNRRNRKRQINNDEC